MFGMMLLLGLLPAAFAIGMVGNSHHSDQHDGNGDGTDGQDPSQTHDTLTGGNATGDLLDGDWHSNTLDGLGGDDTLAGYAGDDVLLGGTGADLLYGGPGNDQLHGGEGNDTLDGGQGHDTLQGEAGNDVLRVGPGGGDLLEGGAGQDSLFGNDSAGNTLDGGLGNDWLNLGHSDGNTALGGEGNDTIYFGPAGPNGLAGGGVQVADDPTQETFIDGGTGADSIHSFAMAHVDLGQGADSSLSGDGAGDSLLVIPDGSVMTVDHFEPGLDTLKFEHVSDGEISAQDDGHDLLVMAHGQPVARLTGLAGTDIGQIYPGAPGQVNLSTHEADAQLAGGNGDDTLAAYGDAETLLGGKGDDVMGAFGTAGELHGGEGDDTLFGNGNDNHLDGGAGNDLFVTGAHDTVTTGGGEDVIVPFAPNADHQGETETVTDFAPGLDRVELPEGVSPHDVSLTEQGGDLMMSYGGTDVALFNGLAGQGLTVENMLDPASVSLHLAGGPQADLLSGRMGNDVLLGHGGADTLQGAAGDDTLWGGPGDDLLQGGAGNDALHANAGDDTLEGGEGDDHLYVGASGTDHLLGGAGHDTLVADDPAGGDTLSGGAGHDVLVATGAGNSLEGGADADTISTVLGNDVTLDPTGGTAHDTLELDVTGGSGVTTVHDFHIGEDSLDLTAGASAHFSVADEGGDLLLSADGTVVARFAGLAGTSLGQLTAPTAP
ncbi:calcium-binding protein [Thioclava atlantica]|uniref:Calcium binding hemolysin protein n=1 Tax=Thioclava atlantica TaxID=1317124 RepID=A0A085TXB6_9RHOB|nr:calcium-binding protein [Thioclava atlantica]KFE35363.1 calcium binding hemolysin protein [Thioclava atlantica]